MIRLAFLLSCALGWMSTGASAELPASPATEVQVSVDAGLLLDAAGPEQRKSIGAIYLIACPTGNGFSVGTGFLIHTGVMITNSHVVGDCTEKALVGVSSSNKQIRFSRVLKDTDRDLAILVPVEKLSGGLNLSDNDSPEPGTTVTTWGYPFAYTGTSTLLSVGYVSGFRSVKSGDKTVKHIVVNGAFNHGNSGGPLLIAHDNAVIGIVVLTFNFYPAALKNVIDKMSDQKSGLQWTITHPDGKVENVSEAQITAAILNEFYQKTQVMIGEAIAASELTAMLSEHASELK